MNVFDLVTVINVEAAHLERARAAEEERGRPASPDAQREKVGEEHPGATAEASEGQGLRDGRI
jgi:hypothetical protein